MKKTYLSPKVLIVEVTGQQILVGSEVGATGLDGFGGYGGVDDGGGLDPSSRGFDDLFDEGLLGL